MALNLNANVATSSNTSAAPAAGTDWKSDYFLNAYLPGGDGQPLKVGALGLKLSDPLHEQLCEFLKNGGDEAMSILGQRLQVTFAKVRAGTGFALPGVAPAQTQPKADFSRLAAGGEKREVASAYLNFYLPTHSGKLEKIGAIGLKSSGDEGVLQQWIASDVDANLQWFVENVSFTFNSAQKHDSGARLNLMA